MINNTLNLTDMCLKRLGFIGKQRRVLIVDDSVHAEDLPPKTIKRNNGANKPIQRFGRFDGIAFSKLQASPEFIPVKHTVESYPSQRRAAKKRRNIKMYNSKKRGSK